MLYKKYLLHVLLFSVFFIGFCTTVNADATGTIEDNLGVSAVDIIMFISVGGCIVITAFDLRVAIMLSFLLFASEFILFTLATEAGYDGFNPYRAGLAMMLCFVILTLSLLISYKKTNAPGNVV